jgi:hypothetical protein
MPTFDERSVRTCWRLARRFTGFAAVWLVAQGAGWMAADPASGSAGTPRLVVETSQVDLGSLIRGQKAEAEFRLRNAGDAVLRLESVKPG